MRHRKQVIANQPAGWCGDLLNKRTDHPRFRRVPRQCSQWRGMTKLVTAVLCLGLLALPVRAEETKYAALTFDDGPSGRYTAQLLDGLAQRGVQATFLLCGYRVEQFPELTQRIFDEGHEIGYHGFSHKDLSRLSRRDMVEELEKTRALLPAGCRPKFLRPPGGSTSDALRQVMEARNLAILSWSVDPRDWATKDAAAIEGAVLDTVKDGDIILLHDTSESSVQAALYIVDTLHDQGYELVTVSQLAYLRHTPLKGGQVYRRFGKKEE